MKRVYWHCRLALAAWMVAAAGFTTIHAADVFGDISVTADAMYTGNTSHGYAESQITLENASSTKTHVVRLYYPDNDYNSYGNSIRRIARTVTLGPRDQQIIGMLQPPLRLSGNNEIHVSVDRWEFDGVVHSLSANIHCNAYGYNFTPTALVSRNLNFESVEKALQADATAATGYTASMAAGAPDGGGGGSSLNVWMPDTRAYSADNWLKLDYTNAQPVERVSIFTPYAITLAGTMDLISASGSNVLTVSLNHVSGHTVSTGWVMDYTLPGAQANVQSIKLNFPKMRTAGVAIDAVQISGSTGDQYASAASASSDNHWAARSTSTSPANNAACLRSEAAVDAWSANWLAYTPFDLVVLSQSDLTAAPPGVLSALNDYLSAGGAVVVFGQSEMPAAWHGLPQKHVSEGSLYSVGFGRCLVFPSANPDAISQPAMNYLRDVMRENAGYWQTLPRDETTANDAMQLVTTLKISTRGIVLIMLIFIIAIGPVNIYVLNRMKRRTWMLWTIPAISLVTTGVVFIYSLLREGITPTTHISGITLIDQTTHHAATVGSTGFYCPLTPGNGLNFEYGTEVTPLISENGGGTSRDVDWTQNQHLQPGWVTARVPAFFLVRKSETARERLELSTDNGQLQVVNGLGAPIKSLWLVDANKHLYQAQSVAAGARIALTPVTGRTDVGSQAGPNALLQSQSFTANTDGMETNAPQYLKAGTYLALLDGNPFIENGLGKTKLDHTHTSAMVYGILDNPANP